MKYRSQYKRPNAAAWLPERPPLTGRSDRRKRIEVIVATTIELLKTHDVQSLNISIIADASGIARTSIYNFFPTVDAIILEIFYRVVVDSHEYIFEYARSRGPQSVEAAIDYIIDGSYEYFKIHKEGCKTLFGVGSGFQIPSSIKDFDKMSAGLFHTLIERDWPFEPMSNDDPFAGLGLLQAYFYVASVQKYGEITPEYRELTRTMSHAYIRTALEKWQRQLEELSHRDQQLRALDAKVDQLKRSADESVLELALQQLTALSTYLESRNLR